MDDLERRLRLAQTFTAPNARRPQIESIAANLDAAELQRISELLRAVDLREVAGEVVKEYFATLALRDPAWVEKFATWLSVANLEASAMLRLLSDLVWTTRSEKQSPLLNMQLDTLVSIGHTAEQHLIRAYIYLQAARFDFNFSLIERILHVLGRPMSTSTPYLNAMRIFADLGRGGRFDRELIQAIADSTEDAKVLQVLLHALWFTSGTDQAQMMLELSERLLAIDDSDSVTHMRRMSALRRLGRFDEALSSIDLALSRLMPDQIELHSMYSQERAQALLQRDVESRMNEVASELSRGIAETIQTETDRYSAELKTQSERAREQTAEALFKVVEILGLFTAIIAILATVVSGSFVGGILWWQRLIILSAGGIMTLGFFWLLRFVVQPSRERRNAG